ncbi:MAG TPA: S8 family serine peptidase [Gemmatimonadales bacterium]|jgi:subtilisin family serine protease
MKPIRRALVLVLAAFLGCGPGSRVERPAPATGTTSVPAAPAVADAVPAVVARPTEPIVPPPLALLAGLMPLRSTGVEQFRAAHPTYDGRGVLIGILDSGIDPGVAGLIATSTGAPKILDLRDFSDEGRIDLRPVSPGADGTIAVAGRTLRGAARIGRLAVGNAWHAGVFRELPLGPLPAADVNGNGTNTDEFPVVVVRATDGWVMFFDSNRNGTFEDEMPLRDYRQGRQTIALGRQPLTLAANFAESNGVPRLDLYFDTSGHGTHVAGIAAGHAMFNIATFEGVAPGAQLLGLKIANDARGGISMTGSMQRAMDYAARFAMERGLPLVLNMSFGVGNEREGRAVLDSLINAFLLAHPDVVFTISAGNDGPGLSTMGFPGSADLALTVGALEPGAFTRVPQPGPPPPDRMGWWSSRGGDVGKPDVVAPGQAFSTVPRWDLGDEIKSGTSMASPHVAGLVARLRSALAQENRRAPAADIMQALRATAAPLAGWTIVDAGPGVPRLEAAYQWLIAGHQGSRYVVRTADGAPAALRRDGFARLGDTLQVFTVTHADGLRAAQFRLTSDAPWLTVPALVTSNARRTSISVGYRPALLPGPGVYVGTVTARNPSDSVSGPLFTLVNTVVVPHDLSTRPLEDASRAVGAGRVQRYFLRSPVAGRSMRVRVALGDIDQEALVQLYDPNGRPASADPDSLVQVGYGKAASVVIELPAEDMLPGVYELDVINPGINRTTATVQADLALVAMAPQANGTLEAMNPGVATANLEARATLVGAQRSAMVAGRGTAAESLAVAVPAWAVRAEVLVEMPREQWDGFSDFGLTVFDSAGQQVDVAPLNYARGRLTFPVSPRLAGHPAVIELYPAFAREGAVSSWQASVRVRFFGDSSEALGGPLPLTVVAGGRIVLPAALLPFGLLEGLAPLVEWRLSPIRGSGASALTYQAVRQP